MKTIEKYGKAEHVDRKSRFIGEAFPVTTEEEAKQALERVRKAYWDASHHCYAYRLDGGRVTKCSDDREPSGTAGAPMLQVLLGEDLSDVLVVVTRYFGGTLLGTGGLVKAYTKATQLAVEAAGILEKKIYLEASVSLEYNQLSRLQYWAEQSGYVIVALDYHAAVDCVLCLEETRKGEFLKSLTQAFDGKLVPEFGAPFLSSPAEIEKRKK